MKACSRIRVLLSLLCVLALGAGLCPRASAIGTEGLPKNWWSVWEPYEKAVEANDAEAVYQAGNAVEALYLKSPRNVDIANHLTVIYDKLLTTHYFENKNDYAGAAENTRKLIDAAQYLVDNGETDLLDSVVAGKAHLDVLGPFTGVYAASATAQTKFDSKTASVPGSWYGSVFQGYLAESGKGSIASLYVKLDSETVEEQDYLLQKFDDGKHVVLVNLNYGKEGATARAIPSGAYDDNLKATMSCLAKYDYPILMRVGGEMNIWSDAKNPTADYVSPADFIASYRYVAGLAKRLCPNVELVWSPMYSTRWGETYDEFYPGDSYVDWVGLSLYYNYADQGYDAPAWLEHNRLHEFADPLLCVKNVAEFARAHHKPVIATEGGAYKNGPKGESYAAAKNAKAFAVVTMVYPEVKGLVYFDLNISETDGKHDYRMEGAFRSAMEAAIDANPSLRSAGKDGAMTYVPLEQFREKTDSLILGATGYTYNDADMKVAYTLDGAALSCSGAANRCVVSASKLTNGAHALKVTFTDRNGYTEAKDYTLTREADGTVVATAGAPAPAQTPAQNEAPASSIGVTVNGKAVQWTDAKPFIDANSRTMVPLRAVGDALGLTVSWDGAKREAVFSGGGKTLYFPIDSSTARTGDGADVRMDTAAVIVNDRTYAPVRYLAEYFGRSVDWDGANRTVVIR